MTGQDYKFPYKNNPALWILRVRVVRASTVLTVQIYCIHILLNIHVIICTYYQTVSLDRSVSKVTG
jgi:hypothetical protein